jgi:hypothetical protein
LYLHVIGDNFRHLSPTSATSATSPSVPISAMPPPHAPHAPCNAYAMPRATNGTAHIKPYKYSTSRCDVRQGKARQRLGPGSKRRSNEQRATKQRATKANPKDVGLRPPFPTTTCAYTEYLPSKRGRDRIQYNHNHKNLAGRRTRS